MRLLITGGSSYFGQQLVRTAAVSHTVCATYHQTPWGQDGVLAVPLDVRDSAAVADLVADFQPEAIIHLAGSNRGADMARVIVLGAEAIATAAKQAGIRLIHLSTDVLFDGRKAPYEETDTPTPIHEYGRAKATSERIVAAVPNHVIIRTSLIYSLHHMDHGTAWVVDSLRHGQPVTLFNNQWRMPVTAETLASVCLELLTHPYRGILHVAGRQMLSRATFGLKMLDWWGIPTAERTTLTIAPCPPKAPWPADVRLDLTRATLLLRTPLWGVDEAMGR